MVSFLDEVVSAARDTDKFQFELSNEETVFAPQAYPSTVKPSKSRNKSRQDNVCEGETITDTGSKNMEVLVTGYMPFSERRAFIRLLDEGGNLDMIAEEWTGEIQIVDGEFERSGMDTLYYTLNLLSTGRGEKGSIPGDGILSRGGA